MDFKQPSLLNDIGSGISDSTEFLTSDRIRTNTEIVQILCKELGEYSNGVPPDDEDRFKQIVQTLWELI